MGLGPLPHPVMNACNRSAQELDVVTANLDAIAGMDPGVLILGDRGPVAIIERNTETPRAA